MNAISLNALSPDPVTFLSFPKAVSTPLNLHSTIEALPLHDSRVDVCKSGRDVLRALQNFPTVPGVILMDGNILVGALSRQQFLDYLSRPYGRELFLNHPLKKLLPYLASELCLLPGKTPIDLASRRSLARPPHLLDEPIVVAISAREYRLLSVRDLLAAQSEIYEVATQVISKLYYDLEQANQELERLANLDSLTQVANRRCFDKILLQEWKRLSREKAPLALILCDVDYFKLYNDTYGHPAGDECLCKVAGAIAQSARRSADLVARYGGEEFVVLLPNTLLEGATQVAKVIQANVRDLDLPHARSQVSDRVTISMGIASTTPDRHLPPSYLVDFADRALYQSKAAGRNTYTLFTESL